MRRLPISPPNPDLLVGLDPADDAAVYRIDDSTALVFTVDFFTPVVDDPYDWGRIAAANAMSDVYAMGGRPLLCLNVAGWPRDDLPVEMLSRVLEGGAATAARAGAIVVGGHTVDDREPKYGMAVVGLVDPAHVITNAAARPGDVLVLTKPLGLGVISTAVKNGVAPESVSEAAVEIMVELNDGPRDAMLSAGVRAATDVTGFGLLGHLQRMCAASGVSAEVRAAAVPVLDGAEELAAAGQIPGGSRRNRTFVEEWATFAGDVGEVRRTLLADAQTSGGMLICCPPDCLDALLGELDGRAPVSEVIGVIAAGPVGRIQVCS